MGKIVIAIIESMNVISNLRLIAQIYKQNFISFQINYLKSNFKAFPDSTDYSMKFGALCLLLFELGAYPGFLVACSNID